MRALLVVNPAATTTSPRTREVLAQRARQRAQGRGRETSHRGHAAELAGRGRRDGLDVVVALGGDGTVNEVVNGLLADGAATPDVPGAGGRARRRHQRVRPRPRAAAATRSRRPARCWTRCATAAAAASGSAWPATAGSPSTPGWAWTPRSSPGSTSAGGPGDQTGTPTPRYVRAALAQFFLHTDRRHPALTLERARRGAGRRAAPGDRRQHRALDLPRGPAAPPSPGGVVRHRAGPLRADPAADRRHAGRGRAGCCAAGRRRDRAGRGPWCTAARPGRADPARPAGRSRPRSTARRWATCEALTFRVRPERPARGRLTHRVAALRGQLLGVTAAVTQADSAVREKGACETLSRHLFVCQG